MPGFSKAGLRGPERRATVMLVSVGGAVSEGILESLRPHRDRLVIVGTTTEPSTAAAGECDICVRVAPASEADRFASDMLKALRTHRPVVALPCRDADMPALARVKAAAPEAGMPLLVGSVALAEAMSDKAGLPVSRPQGLGGVVTSTYVVELQTAAAGRVVEGLARHGVQARRWWGDGCHRAPAFADCPRVVLRVTDDLAARVIGLPLHTSMSLDDVRYVVANLSTVLAPGGSRVRERSIGQ